MTEGSGQGLVKAKINGLALDVTCVHFHIDIIRCMGRHGVGFHAAIAFRVRGVFGLVALLAELMVIKEGIAVLEQELRITTQRVNLFEKVKIPECQENIRQICIYLGDQQANAVGVSKVAKKKIEARDLELVTA